MNIQLHADLNILLFELLVNLNWFDWCNWTFLWNWNCIM